MNSVTTLMTYKTLKVNQVELHPWLPQNDLVAFHNANKIITMGYCTVLFSPYQTSSPSNEPDTTRIPRTVPVFGRLLASKDAIGIHAFAPLEALPCV
jgi:hypothetical protein